MNALKPEIGKALGRSLCLGVRGYGGNQALYLHIHTMHKELSAVLSKTGQVPLGDRKVSVAGPLRGQREVISDSSSKNDVLCSVL